MSDVLTDDEMTRWVTWKRASDAVWDQVVRQISSDTGLSAADFSVLTRVVEAEHAPRQQELADALGWQRSRLSRQLTRMADRGLLARVTVRTVPIIRATARGRAVTARARSAHARAVRTALLAHAPESSTDEFWTTARALGGGPPADLSCVN